MGLKHGVCLLSIVPLRAEASHQSAMLSQLLFGETFEIIETTKLWAKIKTSEDQVEAWADKTQLKMISIEDYIQLLDMECKLSIEIMAYVSNSQHLLTFLPLGAVLNVLEVSSINVDKLTFDGHFQKPLKMKADLMNIALQYLNSPFLSGGKTPFGIDASGFVQMVYRINGFYLPRQVNEQAKLGESLSFIEESEPGDLAFFDDENGEIVHVGIMLTDNYIIHAYGYVRIDRLDHLGIFNQAMNKHTHQLRIIKKVC